MISKYFWFIQSSLQHSDYVFGFVCSGVVVLGIFLGLSKRFIDHKVQIKLLGKFSSLFLTMGLVGLLWFLLRYENTPIFGLRYWAGIIILIALVWLIFILKYWIFNFRSEVREYEHEQIKRRYIP